MTTHDANARSLRINGEMLDSLDEELELEIDDDRLAKLAGETPEQHGGRRDRRHLYFKELFRLQGELVKLQDWVQSQKPQGRGDLRGARFRRQGRRHQTHHPAAQSARLPGHRAAGAERARALPMVLPALR